MGPHWSVPLKLAAERPAMPAAPQREPWALPGWVAVVVALPCVVLGLALLLALSAAGRAASRRRSSAVRC